jgi:hypothetical protein
MSSASAAGGGLSREAHMKKLLEDKLDAQV